MTTIRDVSVVPIDKFTPTTRGGVAIRHFSRRARPFDRKIRVVWVDPDVLAGIMRTVDPVADIRSRCERLEAMQKSRGDVQITKVDVVQHECLALTEGWRVPSRIDDDVEDGTVRAPNEFRLARSRSAVQAAHDSSDGTGLGVLRELRGRAGAELLVKDFDVERPGEQAAFVSEGLWDHQHHSVEVGWLEPHKVIVS